MWWILGSQQSVELSQVQRIILYWERPKRGGEKCENINYAKTAFFRNSRLFGWREFHQLVEKKKCLRERKKKTLLKRCLLERQPICFWQNFLFLFIFIKAFTQALGLSERWFIEASVGGPCRGCRAARAAVCLEQCFGGVSDFCRRRWFTVHVTCLTAP